MKYLDQQSQEVAIIGAGWYGCHIAIALSKNYKVTLFEKNSSIFSGISGKFGIRIHAGQHYPRSFPTRNSCFSGYNEFCLKYKEFVNDHEYSLYAIARKDADGKPSKVSVEHFEKVCKEFKYKGKVNLEDLGYDTREVLAGYDIEEPSATLGSRLRKSFENRLKQANVNLKCDFNVSIMEKSGEYTLVGKVGEVYKFAHVINATSYQALLPKSVKLPFNMEVVYQPCLALAYRDRKPTAKKPFSQIIMDGSFPCVMPYDDRENTSEPMDKYIMTHGKYTISASYDTPQEAQEALSHVTESIVEEKVRMPSEEHMISCWPEFKSRFEYLGWVGAVLAKIKTNSEFRGSVVFKDPSTNCIYVFPGKITNIFSSERDVKALMSNHNVVESKNGILYVKDSIFDQAGSEISEPRSQNSRLTCQIQYLRADLAQPDSKNESEQKVKSNYNRKGHRLINMSSYVIIMSAAAAIFALGKCEKISNHRSTAVFCVSLLSLLLKRKSLTNMLGKVASLFSYCYKSCNAKSHMPEIQQTRTPHY